MSERLVWDSEQGCFVPIGTPSQRGGGARGGRGQHRGNKDQVRQNYNSNSFEARQTNYCSQSNNSGNFNYGWHEFDDGHNYSTNQRRQTGSEDRGGHSWTQDGGGNRGGQNGGRSREGHIGGRNRGGRGGGRDEGGYIKDGNRGEHNKGRNLGTLAGGENRGGQSGGHNRGGQGRGRGRGGHLGEGNRREHNEGETSGGQGGRSGRGGHSGGQSEAGRRGTQHEGGNRGQGGGRGSEGEFGERNRGERSRRKGTGGQEGGMNRGGHSDRGNRGRPRRNEDQISESGHGKGRGPNDRKGNYGLDTSSDGLLSNPNIVPGAPGQPLMPSMFISMPPPPPPSLYHPFPPTLGKYLPGSTLSIPASYNGPSQTNGSQTSMGNHTMNKTERGGRNLPRSVSTPDVNKVGARPKEFQGINQRQQTKQSEFKNIGPQGNKNVETDGNVPKERDSFRNNRHKDRKTDSCRSENNQGFENQMRYKKGSNMQNMEDEKDHEGNEKSQNERIRGGHLGGRYRGRGRNHLYHRGRGAFNRRNENINREKEANIPDNITENTDCKNLTSRQRWSRRYFGRPGHRRWGKFPFYRKNVSLGENQMADDDTSEQSSEFGSTWSLVSEISEISEPDVTSGYDLKLDDLDQAPIQTLKNREKRYKLRLSGLQAMEDKDFGRIEAFKEGLKLMRKAINRRRESKLSQSADTLLESKVESNIDIDDANSCPDMTESKGSKKNRQPRKNNFIATKRGPISFNPKQNIKKQPRIKSGLNKKKSDSELSTEDTMSSDEAEIGSDKDYSDVEEKEKKVPVIETVKRRRRRNKPKKTKTVEKDIEIPGQKEESHGILDDLMSKLDDLCKSNDNNSGTQKNASKQGENKGRNDKTKDNEKDRKLGGLSFKYDCQEPSNNLSASKQPHQSDNPTHNKNSALNEDVSYNGLDVNKVFKFLVKEMGAVASPEDIATKSGLFPQSCDVQKWFRANTRRFTLVERNGKVSVVVAFNKDVTYCLDYITKRSCDKQECSRYHICKDLLCGNCTFGTDQCKFSHNLLDEQNRNLSISKQFGYDKVFTSEDICAILSVRYPRVCVAWNDNGSCEDSDCIGLHLCQRFILETCLEDNAVCPFSHDKLSNHNKPILDAYRMGHWNENLFRRMIFIMRGQRPRTVSTDENTSFDAQNAVEKVHASSTQLSGLKHKSAKEGAAFGGSTKENIPKRETTNKVQVIEIKKVDVGNESFGEDIVLPVQERHRRTSGAAKDKRKRDNISLTEDKLGDKYICDENLTPSGCKNVKCRYLHLYENLPYIWQIKLFGQWACFPHDEVIEQAYCNMDPRASTELERDATLYRVDIVFEPNLHAFINLVNQTDGQDIAEVRRLTTRSYMTGTYKSQGYKTQWRWYFLNDVQQWELFETNMQYTLEQKLLAGQKQFLYPRNNFKFRYEFNFDSMKQINMVTGKTRDACRRPILVSRGDLDTGVFPGSLKAPPSYPQLPRRWYPWDLCNQFEFVRLPSSSVVYEDVASSFFKTMDKERFKIDDIFRVQNPDLWRAFCTEETSMQVNLERTGPHGAVLNKRELFHGTGSLDAVRGIAINNFDFRISGKNGVVYGEGAYFARDAKYSHSYTQVTDRELYMFRASVLVGEYTKAQRDYKRPPPKPNKAHELYDSCVDNEVNPTIFVLFDRAKYYPEYLITYHDGKPPYEHADLQSYGQQQHANIKPILKSSRPTPRDLTGYSPSQQTIPVPTYPSSTVSYPSSPSRSSLSPSSPSYDMSQNVSGFYQPSQSSRRSPSPPQQVYSPTDKSPSRKKQDGCSIQ